MADARGAGSDTRSGTINRKRIGGFFIYPVWQYNGRCL